MSSTLCDVCDKDSRYMRTRLENAKLRELVAELMHVVCGVCHGRICEVPEDEHPFVTCTYNDRIKELEVPL